MLPISATWTQSYLKDWNVKMMSFRESLKLFVAIRIFFPLRKQQEEMLRILLYSKFVGCQRVKLGCIHSIKSCSWYPWNIDDKWFKPYQVLPGGCNFQRGKGTTSHGPCPGFNNPEMYTTAVDRIENRHEYDKDLFYSKTLWIAWLSKDNRWNANIS